MVKIGTSESGLLGSSPESLCDCEQTAPPVCFSFPPLCSMELLLHSMGTEAPAVDGELL